MLKYFIFDNKVHIIGCDKETLKQADGILNIPTHIDGKKVTDIFKSAFNECTELKKVIIDGDLCIDWSVFEHCTNLKSFIAPKITRICSPYVFYGCKSLVEVD